MTKNLSTIDRIIRTVAAGAVALLMLAGVLSGTSAIIFGAMAIVLLLTGAVSFCPLYAIIGISTKKKAATN